MSRARRRVVAAKIRLGCPTGESDLAWRSLRMDLKRRKPAGSFARPQRSFQRSTSFAMAARHR